MKMTCGRCGRPVQRVDEHRMPFGGPAGRAGGARLYFVHDFLGCDSGCCGHRFYVLDQREHVVWSYLMLDEHRWDTLVCQAEELARRFGTVVDWAACDYLTHEEAQKQCTAGRRASSIDACIDSIGHSAWLVPVRET